jgi:hypothetical protein
MPKVRGLETVAYKTILRASTKLEGEKLEKLLSDLNCAIGVYRDHTSEQAERRAAKVSHFYDRVAREHEHLVELATSKPESVVHEQRHRARLARVEAELHSIHNPRNRPGWKGECRDYLARKAREIIEQHCNLHHMQISKPNLRRAVAAVLDYAGAPHLNPKKEGARFDAMFVEPARLSADELEARANKLADEKGLGDCPI